MFARSCKRGITKRDAGWLVLTDNEPRDDQLSTATEARGPGQAVDRTIGTVPAGRRPEEPRTRPV